MGPASSNILNSTKTPRLGVETDWDSEAFFVHSLVFHKKYLSQPIRRHLVEC